MPFYELTQGAEQDLREIARYTLKNWGSKSLESYWHGLKNTFKTIGKNDVIKRQFSDKFSQLLVTKYRYHFIFYITNPAKKPVIIAIIHEKMDIVKRLVNRLN